MTVPIQISAWNINGHRSRIIGDKVSNSSFLDEIKNDDIVALIETHDKNDTLSIPGYERVKLPQNVSTSIKSNKCSGGLAYFAKPEISKFVIPINNDNKDTIWIKIKKDIIDKKHDIYVGTVYLPPYKNNQDNSKKILNLFEEIFSFQKKGMVIVQGDFNARTNVNSDTVTRDKYDPTLVINHHAEIPCRNSQDKVPTDHRGKELLELCKSLGLITLNGRKIGDLFGNFTSFQWNGNSVVDYVLVDQSIFSSISFFKVGNFIPWLSDHCPIRFRLESYMDRTRKSEEALDREQLDSLFWDNDSPGKFLTILETHEQEIGEILTSSNINILENFQNIIKTVIEEGRFKKRKKKPSNDAIWFDMDCKKAKEEVTTAGKKVQSTPNDPSLREILADKKKIFRKLVREKKRTHENKNFE